MREIKFRAWDGKKMQYDVFPTSDNTVGRWIETGGGIELRFCDGGGTKVDIMQFTGLKDKNGTEIYEGDIIVINGDKYVCEYGLHSWSGEFRFWILPHKKWSDGSFREKEVIGNKAQHPKLLEQDNA